jgi:hypothetical protein
MCEHDWDDQPNESPRGNQRDLANKIGFPAKAGTHSSAPEMLKDGSWPSPGSQLRLLPRRFVFSW